MTNSIGLFNPMISTIGLEVHAQLATRTKIFCGCELRFGSPPNTHVCPVCLGLPGVLPVLNREAFSLALRAVIALNGTPSEFIKFDRKNYYYPDLPKGYQISQFDRPIGKGGWVEIGEGTSQRRVKLNRVHMEEDAGKLIHDLSSESHVDLNRAGTPLIEIVTEPDLETPDEAYAYLTNLKAILKSIGVSACDMEKGQLRCDANVSVRADRTAPLGTKIEIKNLNSFKAVKAALEYEIERQIAALGHGEKLVQETRLWDDDRGSTSLMRSKEEAHDYRYFPEPDLVPFTVSRGEIEETRRTMPKLPAQKKEEFRKLGLKDIAVEQLAQDDLLSGLFEEIVTAHKKDPKGTANFILNSLVGTASAAGIPLENFDARRVAALQTMIESGQVSLVAATSGGILEEVFKSGSTKNPEDVAKEKGLLQVSDDSALDRWIDEAIEKNPKVVADFKSGKEAAAMFLVGQVMRQSKGKANPGKVQDMIRKKLSC